MDLWLSNTLTRKKELFVPITPGKVTMYSCGPTVYSQQHLGNLRAVFVVELLRNILKYAGGYDVTHVMNITDVGHLTGDNEGDADHGEDRMEKGSKREGLTAWDVAKKYTDIFLQDIHALRIDDFSYMPKATDHITEQIAIIKELEVKGFTYSIPGDGVYMDTSKDADYGVLISKKHIEGLQSGARIQDSGKKNPTDFALWKFNITGKKRDMEWESPRGIGFPGWHIECSAMSMKYLGDHIDIHTGGVEHVAIHHTNEIAQSECSHGNHPWVNYWVHYQWLMMNGKKIAKSDGNVAFMGQVLEKGYTGEDLRYFFLQAHYTNFQDFTREGLAAAQTARRNIIKKIAAYTNDEIMSRYQPQLEDCNDIILNQLWHHLADDADTPQCLATIRKMLDVVNEEVVKALLYLDNHILKIGLYEGVVAMFETKEIAIPDDVKKLANDRRQAKKDKEFSKSDELRKEIDALGWEVQDEKEGFVLSKKL